MANKLFTFLGTSNYEPVRYYFPDNGKDRRSSARCDTFVQTALADLFCQTWSERDRIYVLLTPEAESQNWHPAATNGTKRTGLADALNTWKNKSKSRVRIEPVRIPNGRDPDELWDIFDAICDHLENNDHVIFDITHSFRSLPVIALSSLLYGGFLRNIQVKHILYGALETLGPAKDIPKIALDQRNVPIHDSGLFHTIAQWTAAVNIFLETGNPGRIRALTEQDLDRLALKRPDEARLNKLAEALAAWSDAVATCRGPELKKKLADVKDRLAGSENPRAFTRPRPFKPLLRKVWEKFNPLPHADDCHAGIAAAHWCRDHNLLQQGYTILHETLLNYILVTCDGVRDPRAADRDHAARQIGKNPRVPEPLRKLYDEITRYRNDINHAGWWERGNRSSTDLVRKYQEHLDKAEKYIRLGPRGR